MALLTFLQGAFGGPAACEDCVASVALVAKRPDLNPGSGVHDLPVNHLKLQQHAHDKLEPVDAVAVLVQLCDESGTKLLLEQLAFGALLPSRVEELLDGAEHVAKEGGGDENVNDRQPAPTLGPTFWP